MVDGWDIQFGWLLGLGQDGWLLRGGHDGYLLGVGQDGWPLVVKMLLRWFQRDYPVKEMKGNILIPY